MQSWLAKEQALFSQHIKAGNLPHAILISGVKGCGKNNLANWLIQVIQCNNIIEGEILQPCQQCKHCNLLLKNNYPDHTTVTPEKNLLGIDSVRKISSFFEKTAQIGTVKSVLIPEANKMTVAAANALLKTLEEPTNNSIIILLSNERDVLLPTIISRCRLFEIRPPSGDVLAQYINNGSEQDNAFINLSHLPELSSKEIANEYSTFEHLCLAYLTKQEGRSQIISLVFNSAHGLRWLEKVIVTAMRNTEQWSNHLSLEQKGRTLLNKNTLWHIYNKIVATIGLSKTLSQVNNQFMIEKLIIDIDTILNHEKFQE